MKRFIRISTRVGLGLALLASGCVRAFDLIQLPGDSEPGRDQSPATADRGIDVRRPDGADRPAAAGCARRVQATFCADFDGPDPISLGTWSDVDDGGGKGAITLSQVALSPPNAASLRSVASAGNYNVLLRKNFVGAVSGAKAVTALRTDGDVLPMGWEIIQGGTHYFILGGLSAGAMELHVQRFIPSTAVVELAYRSTPLPSSPFNLWTEVELAFESSPTRTARFRVGDAELSLEVAAEVPYDSPSFVVGQWNTVAGRTALVDDVGVWISR
jgi:hypothetical protein